MFLKNISINPISGGVSKYFRGISGKAPGGGAFFLLASFQIKKFTKSKLGTKYGSESKFSDIHMVHTVFASET